MIASGILQVGDELAERARTGDHADGQPRDRARRGAAAGRRGHRPGLAGRAHTRRQGRCRCRRPAHRRHQPDLDQRLQSRCRCMPPACSSRRRSWRTRPGISAPTTSGASRIRSRAQELACNDPVRFLICDREFHLTIYYASPQPAARRLRRRSLHLHARPSPHRHGQAGRHRKEPRGPPLHRQGAEDAQSGSGRGRFRQPHPAHPRHQPRGRRRRRARPPRTPALRVRLLPPAKRKLPA